MDKYLGNSITISLTRYRNSGKIATTGFPKLNDGSDVDSSPNIPDLNFPASQLIQKIQYQIPPSPDLFTGFRVRNNSIGTISVTDANLNPVSYGVVITVSTEDVARRIRYRSATSATILNGYEIRKYDGSLAITNTSFVVDPTAVIEENTSQLRRHERILVGDTQEILSLIAAPIYPELVELVYRGWHMSNGLDFIVNGSFIDFSFAGLTLGAQEKIDVYYEID